MRKVTIERKDDAGKGVWDFPCYRWLDPDKDDLCPYRTLTPQAPGEWKVGDATQLAALPKYTDGVYDSSLCLPQHACEVAMYTALASRARPRTFVETLIRGANPKASDAEMEQLMQSGKALNEALPAVWGEIDDEGDGEPDPDDYDYTVTELFDVVQSWVLRRTNIRPVRAAPHSSCIPHCISHCISHTACACARALVRTQHSPVRTWS